MDDFDITVELGRANSIWGLKSVDENDENDELMLFAKYATTKGVVLRHLPASSEGKPEGKLLAWPSERCGVIILAQATHEPGAPAFNFEGCWPFANSGIEYAFEPEEIYSAQTDHRAAVRGHLGGLEVTLFDALCSTPEPWFSGPRMVKPCGWITEIAPTEAVRVHVDDLQPSWRQMASIADAHGFVQIEGLNFLWGAYDTPSPLHWFGGQVGSVGEPLTLGHLTVWPLWMRFPTLEKGQEIELELLVSNAIWQGPPPRAGQMVQGQAWLQFTAA